MYMAQKVRNKLRAFLQAYGPKKIKRALWNTEFSRGRWECLESSVGNSVYQYIEKYANKGSVLDLGCGSGSTGNELDAAAYLDYTGVDISDVAIAKARVRTEENRRADKNSYLQSDIFTYVPTRQFDVILFRDSIYYLPQAKIKRMLDRYSRYLKEGGVFIVTVWTVSGKYKKIVDMIEGSFDLVERNLLGQNNGAVFVFRARNALE
jgi:SAM-dependent methyltransferase